MPESSIKGFIYLQWQLSRNHTGVCDAQGCHSEVFPASCAQLNVVAIVVMDSRLSQHSVVLYLTLSVNRKRICVFKASGGTVFFPDMREQLSVSPIFCWFIVSGKQGVNNILFCIQSAPSPLSNTHTQYRPATNRKLQIYTS